MYPNGTTQSFTPTAERQHLQRHASPGSPPARGAGGSSPRTTSAQRGNTTTTTSTRSPSTPVAAAADGDVANAPWTGGGTVQNAAGRIYFEMPTNNRARSWAAYVCSGTVAEDATTGRSVIITAAHCVYDDVHKAFARNVLFIPNQDGTTGTRTDTNCGNDPMGCWTPSFGVVDTTGPPARSPTTSRGTTPSTWCPTRARTPGTAAPSDGARRGGRRPAGAAHRPHRRRLHPCARLLVQPRTRTSCTAPRPSAPSRLQRLVARPVRALRRLVGWPVAAAGERRRRTDHLGELVGLHEPAGHGGSASGGHAAPAACSGSPRPRPSTPSPTGASPPPADQPRLIGFAWIKGA